MLPAPPRYYALQPGTSSKVFASGAMSLAGAAFLSVADGQQLDLSDTNVLLSVIQFAIDRKLVPYDLQDGIYVLVPAIDNTNIFDPGFCTQ